MYSKYLKICQNLIAPAIICCLLYILALGIGTMFGDTSTNLTRVTLDSKNLPVYFLKTAIRFITAIFCSIIFAIIYATLAAKNKRIGKFLIPILDIFQSVPVIGYLSFTITFFVTLFPNDIFGIELAAIFAIFTSQVWNIIFSIYQSLITVPKDLYEVGRVYKLNSWKIFWIIELPFAIPGIVWNVILSMSASWFFIVAQEVISVGDHNYALPGMGTYIALALQQMDISALIHAGFGIFCLIFLFNELLYKPLIAWSDKYRYEFNANSNRNNNSWFLYYIQQSTVIDVVSSYIGRTCKSILNFELPKIIARRIKTLSIICEILWWISISYGSVYIIMTIYRLCYGNIFYADIGNALFYGTLTALRILALLTICSLIWIPAGIYIGLRPNIAARIQAITQFLTAIPANLYYPFFVTMIINYKLDPNIWLSLMLLVGAQWYILYNVIGGAQSIPTELLEVSKIFKLSSFDKIFKIILPSIAPHYMAGVITAAGASWNASIVAEIMHWGGNNISASGIGTYIAKSTSEGNYPHITLGIIVMCIFVITINRFVWKPLSTYISLRFRLE